MPGSSGASALIQSLVGRKRAVDTPRGQLQYRQGGIPGLLADVVGGTAHFPGLGPVSSSEMTPVSAIHETAHGSRAGLFDLGEFLKGNVTEPSGTSKMYWSPSEIWAYTSQPADMSQEDITNFAMTLMDQPDLEERYRKYRNPESDWPADRAGFAKLGYVNSDIARERLKR